jgi:hypothetical protein
MEPLEYEIDPDDTSELVVSGTGEGTLLFGSGECSYQYVVTGQTATAVPGQTCTDETSFGSLLIALVRGTFSTPDGRVADGASEFEIVTTPLSGGGEPQRCTLNGNPHYSKVE